METEYLKVNVWLDHIDGCGEVNSMFSVSVEIKGYCTRWLFCEEEKWRKSFRNPLDVKYELEYWKLPFTVNYIPSTSMKNDRQLFDKAKALFSGKMSKLGINL